MKTVSPYLSAEVLGLKEDYRQSLIGLATDLAHHRIPDNQWRFASWNTCICGHLKKRTGAWEREEFGGKISDLFTARWSPGLRSPGSVTQEEAGQATFNFLTVGEPRWNEVLGA